MAGFNSKSAGMRTTNRSGHAAYKLDDRTKLVTMALTTMLNEKKFYGDNTGELIQLAERMCRQGDGEFVAKLAVWARAKGNLRSVSHALLAVVVRLSKDRSVVRPAVRIVASQRGDDGTEIMATYLALYGHEKNARHPNALRRGIRDALERTSPFALAKYQSANREFKLRDSIRLNRPVPSSRAQSEAFDGACSGTLAVPKSWETELSARGNTKEVWDELIAEDRVGIFACVRNLRNMLNVGADIDPVLAKMYDRDVIARSRMLPFRFYSAYDELAKAGLATTKVTRALDAAILNACANVDQLPGRTAVLIDVSGSMSYPVSRKSVTQCRDIAAILGAMSAHISDDAIVIEFSNNARVVPMAGVSVLSDMGMVGRPTGGTDMAAGFRCLIDTGFDADRVIILSDNEVNGGWYSRNNKQTIQRELEVYRRKVGHDVWCHAIDLQGYGTSQVIGHHTNVMAGWSDSVLRFLALTERGDGSLIAEIEAVEL